MQLRKFTVNSEMIEPNRWTRPGIVCGKDKIIVHWVGNPGTTAAGNANWLRSIHRNPYPQYVSWHYTIGLGGEVEQTLPEEEMGYHASSLAYNRVSIGIECCHPDMTGKFTGETYSSLVKLVRDIAERWRIGSVLRHYDCPRIPRKVCPKWFVEHPKAWEKFLKDVRL